MDLSNLPADVWLLIGISAVLGMALGALITWLAVGRGPSKSVLAAELEAAKTELDAHKSGVDEHFQKTSELVNELTESYVKVYKHLSDGAQHLAGVGNLNRRLTLDDSDHPPVIEASAAATTSNEAVEETLAELEQTAQELELTGEGDAALVEDLDAETILSDQVSVEMPQEADAARPDADIPDAPDAADASDPDTRKSA
ncbi:MAG: DUF1043 family protein [Pseudomonadota bacterium]